MKQTTAEFIIEMINAPASVMRVKGRASIHILVRIAQAGGEIALKDLYNNLIWTDKTLRGHLIHLENDRMIEIIEQQNDNRAKLVRLTTRGVCKLEKYEKRVFEIIKTYA